MSFNSPSFRLACASPALLVFMTALALAISPASQAVVRFVDASSPGPVHNGSSWTQAHTTLSAALSAAASGDEIWVANGTHLPTTTTDRNISFEIPSGVKVFGGFAGFGLNESLLSQRDILVNRTILSGNIGSAGTNTDNSFTVVTIANGAASSTRLDGVFITAGNANGGGSLNLGAGLDIGGNPTIRNCVFVGNTAASRGGAVFCSNTVCNFVNCVFSGNTAPISAAVDVQNGRAGLLNCTINANTCTIGGAAVQYLNGDGFSSVVRNTILFNNTAPNGSAQEQQIAASNSSIAVSRSCIQGLDGSLGGTGNIAGAPRFIDANGTDNVTGTVDDNLALRGGSAGIDAGDNAMVHPDSDDLDEDGNTSEPGPFDLDYQPRFHDDIVNNTGAGVGPIVDMGAYEFKQPVRVICVNDNATGNGFGATWENAFTSLQDALQHAGDIKDPDPEVIWVAQGTYKPSLPAGRAATFAMISGLKIYGGFDDSGTQGSISQRTPDLTQSILSGDIGAAGNNADNCFHVVTANGANFFGSVRPTLDGFVVAQGNCNGASADMAGGGIRCFGTTVADPVIRNCKFVGNAGSIASAADSINSDASFINCVFSGNTQTGGGGVIRLGNVSTPSLLNCTIANNTPGGVITSGNANVTITNCIAVNNGNLSQPDQISLGSGTLAMDYCCVQNLTGSLGGTGNIGVLPLFVDPNGSDETFGTGDDDYRLQECTSVIDAGNFNALPTDGDDLDADGQISERLPMDLASLDRALDDLGILNTGLGLEPTDMGAYEFQDVSGGTCPADLFPTRGGNGVVNVADLLEVVASWGACNGCETDISPTCGNGQVNVGDLLVVIGMWGQCP